MCSYRVLTKELWLSNLRCLLETQVQGRMTDQKNVSEGLSRQIRNGLTEFLFWQFVNRGLNPPPS